ncbi:Catalytic LigB subunit of aromatic ring-opening dioxygenase [Amycolatopsis xylanica]|uniref:Catalytic LigB subunit of aromatic ring-opening dioxygenase n=1 Tax=Amycolatopsis xylanica TaxID=589385 RepID=A0A1H3Q3L4_9PSEU|nr:class III extradiol dioxygenase subunit B-like domain-containing protein [Amycolatopsis xylanica]SDZ07977.1 Catalytic LigB subunit of aromatic ring-opening dioxygenase [Amycolatopsis xylanica]
MITQVVTVPQPPLLVPELAAGAAPETAQLREACLSAVRTLGGRWLAVAAGPVERTVPAASAGSFRGYGADVRVTLAGDGASTPAGELPLPALIAGWLRGQAGAESVDVRIVDADATPDRCAGLGGRLDGEDVGLLVLGDGSNRHGPRSPGNEDERAPGFDEAVAAALGKADLEALRALDPGLCAELGVGGRVPWQVLAGLADGASWRAELLYTGAPHGVGYHVAVWERG